MLEVDAIDMDFYTSCHLNSPLRPKGQTFKIFTDILERIKIISVSKYSLGYLLLI